MTFDETPIAGAYLITPSPRGDHRGWFMRTFDRAAFLTHDLCADWVQMNHSMTTTTGSIRGMHFQHVPAAEVKLVRCVAGRVFDVLVDLRPGSPTRWQWFGTELSAGNQQMLYIPEGCAHGFQTLEPNCELVYCHSAAYAPDHEDGVRYNDPKLNITWPLPVTDISARDMGFTLLDDSMQ
ncbi:dTDP-4-dehydrorhamnose 3,5-epimerase [Fibrella sp. USSR17]